MWCLRQEELLHLSIHNLLAWQESNIGRIMTNYISIQSKILQELFVWLRMTSEFFHLKPPSKTWKRLFGISFFSFFKDVVDHYWAACAAQS